MLKKILSISLFSLLSYISFGQQFIIETTSSSSTWSPLAVTNQAPGNILSWTASWPIVGGGTNQQTIVANDPTFDLQTNIGTATITVESSDGFIGLTNLRIPSSNLISTSNLSQASSLGVLFLNSNQLSDIDVTGNTGLARLWLQDNDLTTIDISNNTALIDLRLGGNNLSTAELDNIINQLDANGLTGGTLQIANQTGGQLISLASQPAYDNLVNIKGWTINVAPPQVPVSTSFSFETTSTSGAWSPLAVTNQPGANVLSWTAVWPVIGGGTDQQTIIANDPTFNLSANIGTATITVESIDGFVGLTNLRIPVGSIISASNLSQASSLGVLFLYSNQLTDIDVSGNTGLARLWLQDNDLTTIDISNNTALIDLRLVGNNLSTVQLDNIINQLAVNGLPAGTLQIANQTSGQTISSASLTAYNSLISDGWTIDVPPSPPIIGPAGTGGRASGGAMHRAALPFRL